MKGKYLITTDAWFFAPNGKQYRGAWGEVEILGDNILGIKTNVRSTNWYAKVGSESNHVIIAGCQIHYACKSEKKPNDGDREEYSVVEGVVKKDIRPSDIYIAE